MCNYCNFITLWALGDWQVDHETWYKAGPRYERHLRAIRRWTMRACVILLARSVKHTGVRRRPGLLQTKEPLRVPERLEIALSQDVRDVATTFRSSGQNISAARSEEHTSELQSLMRISYAVFCLQKKK